jgi:hypothetical protein
MQQTADNAALILYPQKNYQSLPSTRFELFAGESFRIITSDLCTFR